jgi:hypothetical protein
VQISQDKSIYLTCEHRLYFNEVWQNTFVSKAASGTLQSTLFAENQNIRKFDVSVKERNLRQSIYALSSVRDGFVKQSTQENKQKTQMNYQALLKADKDQQTDF